MKVLYRDVLGIEEIDSVRKKLKLRFAESPLAWCEGRVPAAGGAISLRWWKEGADLVYHLDTPAGYGVMVENRSGGKLAAR